MSTVFVTGGTGLIGSNICQQLIERGDSVHALARPGSDFGSLRDLGVTIVEGDITDAASVRRASEGCEYAIHSAAVLGGASQDMGEHQRVNTGGVSNVFDAAEAHGMKKVVTLGTTTYFLFEDAPLSESSPLHPDPATDPYTQTKRGAFVEAMRRAEEGMDVSVVIRVHEITAAALDADAELRDRVGPSLDALARQSFPEPYFDNAHTRSLLGYKPKSLDEGLQITVDWLREHKLMA